MGLIVKKVSELKSSVNENHRRHKNFAKEYAVLVVENGAIDYKIKFRLYYRKNAMYGELWLYTDDGLDYSATTKATGGGYNMENYILNDCLKKIGFEVSEPMTWGVDKVLVALLDCLYTENYFSDVYVNVAHG